MNDVSASRKPARATRHEIERWITLVAGICAIIPVAVGTWSFVTKRTRPRLAVVIDPTRALVADPRPSSRLKVFIDDVQVRTPVYATQIMVYNAGATTIKPTDVTAPLRIKVTPAANLVDVRTNPTDEAVAFTANTNDPAVFKTGEVPLSFKILEHATRDGAVLQVVYVGEPKIEVLGSLTAQRKLRFIPLSRDDKLAVIRGSAVELISLAAGALVSLMLMFSARRPSTIVVAAVIYFLTTACFIWMILRVFITPKLPLHF